MFSYQAAQSQVSKWETIAENGDFYQLKGLLGEINDLSEDEYVGNMTEGVKSFIFQRMLDLAFETPDLSFENLVCLIGGYTEYNYISEEEKLRLLDRMEKQAKDFSDFVYLLRQIDDREKIKNLLIKMKEIAGDEEERITVKFLARARCLHDIVR